ncbi:MAG TPA: hypothetical protein VE422_50255 [Terriglobia bacterium]|nr:hypothetical protein [Terriglobia bacterium]
MNSEEVTLVLKREKELLEQVLKMAQCQIELIETGRIDDLEVLLTLRESAMSEMEMIESQADNAFAAGETGELEDLNIEIFGLANRIAELDERAEWLAEQYDEAATSEPSAAAGLQ